MCNTDDAQHCGAAFTVLAHHCLFSQVGNKFDMKMILFIIKAMELKQVKNKKFSLQFSLHSHRYATLSANISTTISL